MTVKKARETIAAAFVEDPNFRLGYVDNVACVLMDRVPVLKSNKAWRDEIADMIIRLVIES